ncbi:hypothetical protein HZB96_04285 [Candidatus Gottesmanbacteria bacterium]|nr:hypothetical protein [Candidatus Gottesmanbacteria bacterium]MBI5452173.1 hypothetical protein [Candidatus Gottesmanbacteria bacterium]
MTESTQILLFAVVIVLTVLLSIIGWQIFQILSEIRKMLTKFNVMVDGAVTISGNLGKSFKDLSGFSEGIKTVLGFLKIFKKGEKKDEREQK